MANHVILFMPRFVPLICSGTKCRTIRRPRKRRIEVWDSLSLRAWKGKPYRSKQYVLKEVICWRVTPVEMTVSPQWLLVKRDGVDLSIVQLRNFATADGFSGPCEMRDFWLNQYGEGDYFGDLIEW